MKNIKTITTIVLTLFLLICASTIALAERPIRILMGDEYLQPPVAPVIIDGRTMVPLRTVFEGIGAIVEWDNDTQTVTANKGKNIVKLQINSKKMSVNGAVKEIDVPAQLINDRTMVPIRACSEAFGLDVEWDEHARLITIKKEVSLISEKHFSGGNWDKYKYDKNGNLIFWEDSFGRWQRTTVVNTDNSFEAYSEDNNGKTDFFKIYFDDYGDVIKISDSASGLDLEIERDENGNNTYDRCSDGSWTKFSHDSLGRVISKEMSGGRWEKYQYDLNGKEIYYECSDGSYRKQQYDSFERKIFEETNSGWTKYYYNDNNQLERVEHSSGEKQEFVYNSDGYTVKNSDGSWTKYTQDTNGNIIYEENSDGGWKKYIVVKK
jgi:hypothetical protein